MGVTPDGSLPTGVTRVDFGNGRKGFFINEQSDWSPKEDAEAGLGVLATLDLLLVFNKNALSIESLRNGGPMPADYRVRMSAFGFSRSMDVRLIYEPARAALQVEGLPLRVDASSASISNAGSVYGEVDLRGGQFIACIRSASLKDHEKESEEVRKSLLPREVSLRLTAGRNIVLRPSDDAARFSRDDQNCFVAAAPR